MVRVKASAPVMVMASPFTVLTVPASLISTMSIRPAVAEVVDESATLTCSPVERAAAVTACLPSKKVVLASIASVAEAPLASCTVSDVVLAAVTVPTMWLGAGIATLVASSAV